jgi:hypothetical protein
MADEFDWRRLRPAHHRPHSKRRCCRSPTVRGKAILIARWIGRGTFKAAALAGAFVLITALWFWNASLLTRAADENLRLIKVVTQLLPIDWRVRWKVRSVFRS